jgi:hypothetical protein
MATIAPTGTVQRAGAIPSPAPSPWRDYPTLSPFEAVRWPAGADAAPEVMVGGTWYVLVCLDALPATDVVSLCRNLDERRWQKRFEEDLVEVLARGGHEPGDRVTLGAREIGTGTLRTLTDVPMTQANRQRLWRARR